ncbi:MAG: hypothetical protein LBD64_01200 [Odoribacteraceae bacterium]|jgi:hypothetical protein|nr:hypothetical protein [Odoribacteraceae bacterium]
MGKFSSMAILAVVAFTFLNCEKDKKKTENIAKPIATEYTLSAGGNAKFQKLNLVEVNATAVKFALDSVQLNDSTSISIKEIGQVTLTKKQDTVTLSANTNTLAKVYAKKGGVMPTTPEEKTVAVQVNGTVVGKTLKLGITFPKLFTAPVTIDLVGASK